MLDVKENRALFGASRARLLTERGFDILSPLTPALERLAEVHQTVMLLTGKHKMKQHGLIESQCSQNSHYF